MRVRACDAPIKIANLGYLGPTKMNHLDYFNRAYAQPRYRSAAAALGACDISRRRLAPSLEDLLETYTPLVKLTDEEKDLLARRTRSVGLLA